MATVVGLAILAVLVTMKLMGYLENDIEIAR